MPQWQPAARSSTGTPRAGFPKAVPGTPTPMCAAAAAGNASRGNLSVYRLSPESRCLLPRHGLTPGKADDHATSVRPNGTAVQPHGPDGARCGIADHAQAVTANGSSVEPPGPGEGRGIADPATLVGINEATVYSPEPPKPGASHMKEFHERRARAPVRLDETP